MNRRPTMREGAIAPKFTLAAAGVLAAGAVGVSYDWLAGWWLVATGAVAVVTAGLMFWRLVHGVLLALPLWVLLTGAVTVAASPGQVGGWVIAAGVLMLASLAAVAVNWSVGGSVATAAWLLYAGLVLRALPDSVEVRRWWPLGVVAAVLVLVAAAVSLSRSRSSSRGLLRRLGRAGRVSDGMASGWDVWRSASARTLRKKATVLRPSFQQMSRWQRRKQPITELGTVLAKVGPFKLHSACEDHTITFGGPRVGKTGLAINHLVDAPGAAIATSTKTDILDLTHTLRARRGPVWVFDPSGMTVDGSTITFDPLYGCTDPSVAIDRASDLIDGVGHGGDAQSERWDGFAKETLQALLHAAALGGHSMQDVQRWVADPTAPGVKDTVVYELRAAGAIGFVQQASQFFENNPNTRSSISTTIMPALTWLSVPSAVAAASPDGTPFDIARLLRERGTVYLLGADDKKTAPLVTALTAHIARQARNIAVRNGGRLDPQLTMVLDEAALICLIPLDEWTGDFGGRNITIHILAQSRAQLRERFGEAAAGALISNTATKLLFGGMSDDDDLAAWSTLTGDREEKVVTRDRDTGAQSVTNRRVPVLTPGQIGQLRAGQVLILSRAMPPSIGRVKMAWKRWDMRLLRLAAWRDATQARLDRSAEVWGWRYANAAAWVFEHGMTLLQRFADATRPARRSVVARLADALAWLDANDPARELVARLRLSDAMRKARAVLDARTADRGAVVSAETDGGPR